MPHFNTNLPSDYGWGPASKNGENIVPFTYHGHKFYNGVRREMAPWFVILLDLVVPMINGGLYQAHAQASVDDGMWGWEYRQSRNSTAPSVHSWGACIDINAVQNPNGVIPPDGGRYVLGSKIQSAVRAIGGLHGRQWSDNMHIECKLDPAELKTFLANHHALPAPAAPAPVKSSPTSAAGSAFPLPRGCYYGPFSGPAESISGLGKNDAQYRPGLAKVQAKLNLTADGLYGNLTASAVRLFQSRHGIAADGLVGPVTWKALGL